MALHRAGMKPAVSTLESTPDGVMEWSAPPLAQLRRAAMMTGPTTPFTHAGRRNSRTRSCHGNNRYPADGRCQSRRPSARAVWDERSGAAAALGRHVERSTTGASDASETNGSPPIVIRRALNQYKGARRNARGRTALRGRSPRECSASNQAASSNARRTRARPGVRDDRRRSHRHAYRRLCNRIHAVPP
jgi:hypothetical protein